MKKRVVITGMGTINPLGHNTQDTWENVKKGVCGINRITQIDTSEFKVKIAGEVKDYNPDEYLDKKEAKRMDRYTQFAMIAVLFSNNICFLLFRSMPAFPIKHPHLRPSLHYSR